MLRERQKTLQILARRRDKTTIFDASGDIDFVNSPEVRQSVLREIRDIRTSRGGESRSSALHR